MTFIEHERMNGKLTQMLHLNDSKLLETNKHHFLFVGVHITESDNVHRIDQNFYMSKIEQIPSDAEVRRFASMTMRSAWLANTGSDIVFQISEISQVTQVM